MIDNDKGAVVDEDSGLHIRVVGNWFPYTQPDTQIDSHCLVCKNNQTLYCNNCRWRKRETPTNFVLKNGKEEPTTITILSSNSRLNKKCELGDRATVIRKSSWMNGREMYGLSGTITHIMSGDFTTDDGEGTLIGVTLDRDGLQYFKWDELLIRHMYSESEVGSTNVSNTNYSIELSAIPPERSLVDTGSINKNLCMKLLLG